MRKVRSAPQLAGMELKTATASAAAVGSPRHLVAGAAGMQGFYKKATPMVRGESLVLCLVKDRHGSTMRMLNAVTAVGYVCQIFSGA